MESTLSNRDLVRRILQQSSDAAPLLLTSKFLGDDECSSALLEWAGVGCPSHSDSPCFDSVRGTPFCIGTYDGVMYNTAWPLPFEEMRPVRCHQTVLSFLKRRANKRLRRAVGGRRLAVRVSVAHLEVTRSDPDEWVVRVGRAYCDTDEWRIETLLLQAITSHSVDTSEMEWSTVPEEFEVREPTVKVEYGVVGGVAIGIGPCDMGEREVEEEWWPVFRATRSR